MLCWFVIQGSVSAMCMCIAQAVVCCFVLHSGAADAFSLAEKLAAVDAVFMFCFHTNAPGSWRRTC